MSGWVRTPEEWFEEPRIEDVGADAAMLHLSALAYCSRHLTNGHLPFRALRRLYPVADPDREVRALTEAELWEATQSGWFIVDWANHILAADEVAHRREQSRTSSERYRRHKQGDHSMCDRCSAVRQRVSDPVTDAVSDPPPTRSDPIRPEGEERRKERERGGSASSGGSAPLAASSASPPPVAESPPDTSVWVDHIEIRPDGTQVVHDELEPRKTP